MEDGHWQIINCSYASTLADMPELLQPAQGCCVRGAARTEGRTVGVRLRGLGGREHASRGRGFLEGRARGTGQADPGGRDPPGRSEGDLAGGESHRLPQPVQGPERPPSEREIRPGRATEGPS